MENPLGAAAGLLRARLAGLFVSIGLLALFCSVAHAGPYQVYGTEFAWVNNFNNSYSLYGYPAIIRGWHYGFNPAGDNLFPKQLSATSSIPCTFDYSSGGSNMAGDFAYDMFLRWDTAKSTPQVEVMVWAGNDSYPIGTQTGTNVITAGGYTFDLWEGNNSAAGPRALSGTRP